jgi:hypothetical protein
MARRSEAGRRGSKPCVTRHRVYTARLVYVRSNLVVRSMQGWKTHHHISQIGGLGRAFLRHIQLPGPRGGIRSRHGKRDAAAWASFQWATHRCASFLQCAPCGDRAVCKLQIAAVDAVQQMKPNVRLTRDIQRLVEVRTGVSASTLLQHHFRQSLQ